MAIAISYGTAFTLREISESYREIIDKDVSVISELRIANNALDSWKSLVSEGISSANSAADGGYTFFEKTEEEEKLFANAISKAMMVYAPNNNLSDIDENETESSEPRSPESNQELSQAEELFLVLQKFI